ncbi:hypothetical protein RF11_00568 [Thelohanellus kitauei]|uniref:Uncharacterized protein n=1 Tax=Thelohanellus kitauei TaxID=669202 RepID=A0A0C2J8T5_THEKT|nr:hypothetical protein RF11_00568 [Thelohanellus kitauei]
MVKTATTQIPVPKLVDSLSWDELKGIMSANLDSKKFLICERHMFYTELIWIQGETIHELAARALKTAFICAFNDESVLKAILYKSADGLTFSQVVKMATEGEEAFRTARTQLSAETQEIAKVDMPLKFQKYGNKTAKRGLLYNGSQIRSQLDTFTPLTPKIRLKEFIMPEKFRFVKVGAKCDARNPRSQSDQSPKWLKAAISKILGPGHTHRATSSMLPKRRLKISHSSYLLGIFPAKRNQKKFKNLLCLLDLVEYVNLRVFSKCQSFDKDLEGGEGGTN